MELQDEVCVELVFESGVCPSYWGTGISDPSVLQRHHFMLHTFALSPKPYMDCQVLRQTPSSSTEEWGPNFANQGCRWHIFP